MRALTPVGLGMIQMLLLEENRKRRYEIMIGYFNVYLMAIHCLMHKLSLSLQIVQKVDSNTMKY